MKAGFALLVASIVLPLMGVALVAAAGLSATLTASVSGVLLVAAALLGIAAVAIMGESGFAFINRLATNRRSPANAKGDEGCERPGIRSAAQGDSQPSRTGTQNVTSPTV